MSRSSLVAVVLLTLLAVHQAAVAHCDTLGGPVVLDAKAALAKGDVTPVLKWVKADDEKEIREAFAKAMKVRPLSDDARELADRHFFETLVRIHRAGEGMPFTGLKRADAVEPGIAAADKALADGSADKLAGEVADRVAAAIRERFAKAAAARAHAADSPAAGRVFVAAYVDYVHFVEAIEARLARPSAHEHQAPAHQPAVHGHNAEH